MVYVFRGILRALHSFDAAPFPLLLSVRVALTHHSVVAFRVDNSIFNNITIGGFDSSGLLHLYSISTASGASIGLPKRHFKTRSSINSSSVPVSLNYSTAHQLQLQRQGVPSVPQPSCLRVWSLRFNRFPVFSNSSTTPRQQQWIQELPSLSSAFEQPSLRVLESTVLLLHPPDYLK